ncbi:hypothetical protein EYC80_006625 [Monilinia laxa]|uniref:PA14 domain-containing protein n=1 Tax=Monilinia laxa TaxID=61186 RepID=A0A5N6JSI5_MONLA|nr:hypothetical protein EYC80_006625 [Monilinia laxa]
MRFTHFAFVVLTVVGANAAPHPQKIDFEALSPIVQPVQSVPAGITAQVVTYNPAAAAASAAAAVSQVPAIHGSDSNSKRSLNQPKAKDGDCSVQPASVYTGPVPANDRESFLEYQPFADSANSASTPAGYTRSFVNLKASNNALKYMGFTQLPTYDTASCARECSHISGCNSFNLYFERDPTVNPGANCTNPSPMTNVKCVFWGSSIYSSTAVNDGQWRSKFQVAIAGSNGYNIATMPTPGGYSSPTCHEDAAINAPLDCNGDDTFLGSRFFTDTPFDISLCTAACDATTSYNLAHPPATGSPKTCQFINTYVLYLNDVAQGQACAMYTESWDPSYATNTGYSKGTHVYTIRSSYTVSNPKNPNYAKDCKASNHFSSGSILRTSISSALNYGSSISKTITSPSASTTSSKVGNGNSSGAKYGASRTIVYGSIASGSIKSSSTAVASYPKSYNVSNTARPSTSVYDSAKITPASSISSKFISSGSLSTIGYGSMASGSISSSHSIHTPYPTNKNASVVTSQPRTSCSTSASTITVSNTYSSSATESGKSAFVPTSKTSSSITSESSSTIRYGASSASNSSSTSKLPSIAPSSAIEYGYPHASHSVPASSLSTGVSSAAESSSASKLSSSSSTVGYGYPYAYSSNAASSPTAEAFSTVKYSSGAESSLTAKPSLSSIDYGYPHVSSSIPSSISTAESYVSSSTVGQYKSSATIKSGPSYDQNSASAESSAFASSSTTGPGPHYTSASSTTVVGGSYSTAGPSSAQISSTIIYESSSAAVPVSIITVTSILGCTCASPTSSPATLPTSTSQTSPSIIPSHKSANSSDPITSTNLGINVAYFKNPIMNTGYGYPQFDFKSFDAKNSIYNGTSSQIGFSNIAPGSNVTLYSGAPTRSVEQLAIVHTGFLYARQAGNYTFTITAADDVVMGWIGSNAYNSYSARNADLIAANYGISSTIKTVSKTLTAGQLLPFKVLWANDANNGDLGFIIQGPNSTLLSSASRSAKDVITTAPSGTQAF